MTLDDDVSRRRANLSPAKRALLDNRLRGALQDSAAPSGIPVRERHAPIPLSFAQEQQRVQNSLHPGNAAYHVPRAFRLTGPLDVSALERSLAEIVRRHEILRATFTEAGGQLVQVILPSLGLGLPYLDLSHVPACEREAEARKHAAEEFRKPFDLEAGPLFRVRLLGLGEDDHVLLLTMHHVVSDEWSMGVCFNEMLALYEAFCLDRPSPLQNLPIQYADFAVWQRERLKDDALAPHLAYFREQLAGAPAVLTLPYDHTRPKVQTFRGSQESFPITPALEDALRVLGQQDGATLFVVLMAAFHVLLHRHTNQSDIVAGFPMAGRDTLETEELIGIFTNTLVLRTDLSENPSFRELLRQVREKAFGAYEHRDLPIARLVKELQPDRDPSFQVLFNVEDSPVKAATSHGLTVREFAFDPEIALFDLTVEIMRADEGLRCVFIYNTDLFEASTIRRMCGHFRILLEGIVASPDASVAELPLLTPAERRQLLIEWNDTAAAFRENVCLHQLFEEQTARTPEAAAVAFADERLTYHELNTRANQLAHHLRALGTGPDRLVGVYLVRSVEMVVALLATLKAGAAYVPLDPEYPAERLHIVLEDAGIGVVLSRKELAGALPAIKAQVVCLDQKQGLNQNTGSSNPVSGVTPDDLAYVIYTSGSTGTPKGVMNTHRGICNRLFWMQQRYGLDESDRVLQKTPFSFDVSVWEFFWPLMVGAELVVAQPEGHRDPEYLAGAIRDHQVTTMHFVPSMLRTFLNTPGIGQCGSLKRVICSGEALPVDLMHLFLAKESAELHNLYGPTEAAVDVTAWACEPNYTRATVPIGRPIANTQIYITNSHLQPVPIGVAGEILIGGVQLARGYLNQPALTAEKFVPDPFSEIPGARLYRTGDLGRFLPDGTIEYLGRLDRQIKLRGFRIELAEIEALLAQHPDVQETVILLLADEGSESQLVAYIVAAPDTIPGPDKLRAFLSKKLPGYMVPARYMFLEAFPLNPNGKIDRNALPRPGTERPALGTSFVAPRDDLETALVEIWQELLQIDEIGVEDNFFDLGGDSLLATELASHVRDQLGIEIRLRNIFEYPCVAAFARHIDAAREEIPRGTGMPRIECVPRDTSLLLSFPQERLWFLDQYEPGLAAYNCPYAFHIRGGLDAGLVERCLNEMVLRHEILRTTFEERDGSPVQIIASPAPVELEVIDLSARPGKERAGEALHAITKDAERPYDLTIGPLYRTALFKLNERHHILGVQLHHIIFDGLSVRVFLRELGALYEAFAAGKPSPLRPMPLQYADFAGWQQRCFEMDMWQDDLAYWRRQLADLPPNFDLPTDRPRPRKQTYNGAAIRRSLSPELSHALGELSRRAKATLNTTIMAAWNTLLFRYSGQEDMVKGAAVGGRGRSELEGLLGCFVNTVVLRTDLSGDPSFLELLGREHAVALAAYDHQGLPFEKLVAELQPHRDLSHPPLAQIMFAGEDVPVIVLEAGRLTFTVEELFNNTSKFELELLVYYAENGIAFVSVYNNDLFDASTIERMLDHLETILQAVVEDPSQKIQTLPLLRNEERQRILLEWNSTQREYPRDASISELVEVQVRAAPDAVAVISEGDKLTYGALNALANRLARFLQIQGVRPDSLVGVCMERSADMVVAALAVLKAGGAYVPLEPDAPKLRIAAMLKDAGISLVLTCERWAASLPKDDRVIVEIDRERERFADESQENLEKNASGDSLAYVIYTSGSTGVPKGVCISQRAVARLVINTDYCPLGPGDHVAHLSNVAFDAATFELWGPLLNGASLVVIAKEVTLSPTEFAATIRSQKVSTLFVTTALFNRLVAERPDIFASLQTVMFGGEAVDPHWVRAVLQAGAPRRLLHVYGPTEATTFATWQLVRDVPEYARTIPIGRPIANTQVYVLDRHRQTVPVGVPGELYIGGDGVARGYLNRPELTGQHFVEDPFSNASGNRLYRTGDLVRWLPDGEIEFLGRLDHQVKLRGFRIELGEIETVLLQHAGIQAAVVLLREDERGERRLAAYVVPGPDETPSREMLTNFLRERLPRYMVPPDMVFLETLPLTANGKVDRNALPVPEVSSTEAEAKYSAPRSAPEAVLAQIWEQVLDVRPIGVKDNFFDLGGHSLLAVRLLAQIEKAVGKSLPVSALFQAPTIAQLAGLLSREGSTVPYSSLVPIQPNGTKPPMFWVHGVTGHALHFYNLARYMDTGQPAYGLQAQERAPSQMEAIAACYLEKIRTVQAKGPYYLGGYCFGGVLAYEIARQLYEQGETVGLLALLESVAPKSGNLEIRRIPSLAIHLLKNLPGWLLAIARRPGEYLPRVRRKLRGVRKRILRKVLPRTVAKPLDAEDIFDMSGSWEKHHEAVRLHARALIAYSPQSFPGRVTLFKTSTPSVAHLDPCMGWARLAIGGVDVKAVSGAHDDMLYEPHVRELARKLQDCLDQAQETFEFEGH